MRMRILVRPAWAVTRVTRVQAYEKYMCWCTTTEKEKATAIAAGASCKDMECAWLDLFGFSEHKVCIP